MNRTGRSRDNEANYIIIEDATDSALDQIQTVHQESLKMIGN